MKTYLTVVVVVVVVISLLLLVRRWIISGSRPEPVIDQKRTLEEKLEVLAGAGLKLSEPFGVKELLTSWTRREYEQPGYDLVLVGLGMTEEQEPWRNHSVNLWHFDTECIEDHGDYERIVERMVEMTQGSLRLENIRDHVDVEKEEAWFSFSFQGEEQRVDCKVDDDCDPLDQELHGTLGDMLLESERAQEALTEYSIALALNPHDKATANYRMASAHHQLGNDEQSQDHLLQALDLAPNFRPAQKLLLDLMRAGSDNHH